MHLLRSVRVWDSDGNEYTVYEYAPPNINTGHLTAGGSMSGDLGRIVLDDGRTPVNKLSDTEYVIISNREIPVTTTNPNASDDYLDEYE